MVNMALDCANLAGYELQQKKIVAIHIRGNNKQCETTNEKLNMGNITMPEVEHATHLGIIKTTTMKHIGNDRICFSILLWKSSSCSRGFEDGNNSSIP
jgi:hypothetical protein